MHLAVNRYPRLAQFVGAICSEWIAILGGGAVVVLLGVLERSTEYQLPRSAYVALVTLIALFACFRAWNRERTRAELAEETLRPRLRILLDHPATYSSHTASGGRRYEQHYAVVVNDGVEVVRRVRLFLHVDASPLPVEIKPTSWRGDDIDLLHDVPIAFMVATYEYSDAGVSFSREAGAPPLPIGPHRLKVIVTGETVPTFSRTATFEGSPATKQTLRWE